MAAPDSRQVPTYLGQGRVENNLHLAALSPRLHGCVGRESRPSVGAGVPVLRGWLGRPRGGRRRIPHGVHLRDGGQEVPPPPSGGYGDAGERGAGGD